jgi:hypothetical protein
VETPLLFLVCDLDHVIAFVSHSPSRSRSLHDLVDDAYVVLCCAVEVHLQEEQDQRLEKEKHIARLQEHNQVLQARARCAQESIGALEGQLALQRDLERGTRAELDGVCAKNKVRPGNVWECVVSAVV